MIRRKFLKLIINTVCISFVGLFSFKSAFASDILSKIRNRSPSDPKPDSEREDAILPKEGTSVSVEMALNSRCTSDYDDNPKIFHWGMFDKTKKLTPAQIEQIRTYARIPRFTNAGIEIKNEKNILTFIIDNRVTQPFRDWTMIESGMQQQAVGLVCTALGAGYVFSGLGVDGKSISDDKFATVKFHLDAMKPSYSGAYWSTAAPAKTNPWKRGTLPDPIRQGNKPLISTLAGLKTTNEKGRHISINDLGQLLWAARGRTPHFYLSNPWSMTIPTYRGINNISEVFLISDGNVSKYINWKVDNPTHSIEKVGAIDAALEKLLTVKYKPNNCFIVLSKNENPARSLWEIGYQLLNLMLQAQSLGVSYKAILLDDNQRKLFRNSGIKEPVAVLLLQSN
jgi:hypothetical protein